MTTHTDKKAALAYLENNALACVTWPEDGKIMSAIYWNGKRRIQPADKKVNWTKQK
jgi:hypothetical protein